MHHTEAHSADGSGRGIIVWKCEDWLAAMASEPAIRQETSGQFVANTRGWHAARPLLILTKVKPTAVLREA